MNAARPKKALVIGATSRIGHACITRLLTLGYHVTYTTARKWEPSYDPIFKSRLTARKLNLENIDYFKIERWMEDFDLAISIPPIYLSKKFLPFAKTYGVKRLVFVSSYNTYKFGHTAAYAPLKAAEDTILASDLNAIIIQPTMIIGHAQSSATRIILQKAQKGTWFYGVNQRPAMQQPIDFRDLAAALVQAGTDESLNKNRYPVAGQTVTTSHALYHDIARLINTSPRFMTIPQYIADPIVKTMTALRPKAAVTAYLSRLGQDRHCVHDMLPSWSAHYSLQDSLKNLSWELREQA